MSSSSALAIDDRDEDPLEGPSCVAEERVAELVQPLRAHDTPLIPPSRLTRESRSRRKRLVRSTTVRVDRISKRELELDRLLNPYPEGVERPRTRGDCAAVERPCPFVSCRHHLYLDAGRAAENIRLNFPDLEPDELPAKGSCSLDVADEGGVTLERIGELMNVTRERIRQLEVKALDRFQRVGGPKVAALAAEPFPSEMMPASPWDPEEGEAVGSIGLANCSAGAALTATLNRRRFGLCSVCGVESKVEHGLTRDHAEPAKGPGVVRRVCSGSRKPPVDDTERVVEGESQAWKYQSRKLVKAAYGPGIAERERSGLGLWGHARGPRKVPVEVELERQRVVAEALEQLGLEPSMKHAPAVAGVLGCTPAAASEYLRRSVAKTKGLTAREPSRPAVTPVPKVDPRAPPPGMPSRSVARRLEVQRVPIPDLSIVVGKDDMGPSAPEPEKEKTMATPFTERQEALLGAIRRLWKKNGRGPSANEIAVEAKMPWTTPQSKSVGVANTLEPIRGNLVANGPGRGWWLLDGTTPKGDEQGPPKGARFNGGPPPPQGAEERGRSTARERPSAEGDPPELDGNRTRRGRGGLHAEGAARDARDARVEAGAPRSGHRGLPRRAVA